MKFDLLEEWLQWPTSTRYPFPDEDVVGDVWQLTIRGEVFDAVITQLDEARQHVAFRRIVGSA